jgi:PIN domain nuclease of toxin-antitoxin system
MRLLLDTHLLLWLAADSPRLPAELRHFAEQDDFAPVFSTISVLEIAIKHARGNADFDNDPGLVRTALLENDFEELPLAGPHAVALAQLPMIHKDPFDRVLVAQAMVEGLTLLTADATVARYPGRIRHIA